MDKAATDAHSLTVEWLHSSQSKYEKIFPPKTKWQIGAWQVQVISTLLKFSYTIWNEQNTTIHGATVQENLQLQKAKVAKEVINIYQNPQIPLKT